MYTIMGYFPVLRREMSKEFKRVGFKDIKEKRWFLHKVLDDAPAFTNMTIAEMEMVINELRKYKNVSEIE
jgi:hypothetical protein